MKKIVWVFLLALIFRLAITFVWHQMGRGDTLTTSDGTLFYEIAKNLVNGEGFHAYGGPVTRRPPMYPFFLTLFLNFPFPLAAQVAQALLGALSCLILYGIGKELFNDKVGWIAGLLSAVDYLSIRQVLSILTEVLFTFFLLCFFYCIIRFYKSGKKGWILGAGILAGVTLLTKDVLLFYFPLVGLCFLLGEESLRVRLSTSVLFLTVFLATIAPWVIRNVLLLQKPVLITVSSGHTFYLGNGPQTLGGTTGEEWELGKKTDYPKTSDFPPLYTVEADRYLFKKTFNHIVAHPGRFFELVGIKIINMWRPYESRSPLLSKIFTTVTYIPVFILGAVGVGKTIHQWEKLLPIFVFFVYMFGIHAVTLASIRYRFPVMPLLMVFAAYSLSAVFETLRRKFVVYHPCEV